MHQRLHISISDILNTETIGWALCTAETVVDWSAVSDEHPVLNMAFFASESASVFPVPSHSSFAVLQQRIVGHLVASNMRRRL